MEKRKSRWCFFSWQAFCSILAVCVVNTAIWIAFHGFPIVGLPEKEAVQSISITHNNAGERIITDHEDIELIVNAANLLNYSLFGETSGSPIISMTYHLTDGRDVTIEANHTTMWWHGKSHPIKETDMFINVIQGLFF